MYLHIGENVSLKGSSIVGIFDIDKTTTIGETRNFLTHCEYEKISITISKDMPKSFIVVSDKENKTLVYISPISASTLRERFLKGTI